MYETPGEKAYTFKANTSMDWPEITKKLEYTNVEKVINMAREFAMKHKLPWQPNPDFETKNGPEVTVKMPKTNGAYNDGKPRRGSSPAERAERDEKVYNLIAKGLKHTEIAERLDLSVSGVPGMAKAHAAQYNLPYPPDPAPGAVRIPRGRAGEYYYKQILDGEKIVDVARRYKKAAQNVGQVAADYARDNDLPWPITAEVRNYRKLQEEEKSVSSREKYYELLKTGKTPKEIADEHGVSPQNVSTAAKAHAKAKNLPYPPEGYTPNPTGGTMAGGRVTGSTNSTDEMCKYAYEQIAAGVKVADIAKEFQSPEYLGGGKTLSGVTYMAKKYAEAHLLPYPPNPTGDKVPLGASGRVHYERLAEWHGSIKSYVEENGLTYTAVHSQAQGYAKDNNLPWPPNSTLGEKYYNLLDEGLDAGDIAADAGTSRQNVTSSARDWGRRHNKPWPPAGFKQIPRTKAVETPVEAPVEAPAETPQPEPVAVAIPFEGIPTTLMTSLTQAKVIYTQLKETRDLLNGSVFATLPEVARTAIVEKGKELEAEFDRKLGIVFNQVDS